MEQKCPFLSTINRGVLDFDHEKLCSVTLRNEHIYCCLVCGTNFQGRGKGSIAYCHALEMSHHMFINLHTSRIYCLPDNYEVKEHSLDDIKQYLQPKFDKKLISILDKNCKTYDGSEYIPGYIGLYNFGKTDALNVVILMLSRIIPLKDFFLYFPIYDSENFQKISKVSLDKLMFSIIEIVCKIFNPYNFKGMVSPFVLANTIERKSNGLFPVSTNTEKQSNKTSQDAQFVDPMALLSWIIHHMKKKLSKIKLGYQRCFYQDKMSKSKNIIASCIEGQVLNCTKIKGIEPTNLNFSYESMKFVHGSTVNSFISLSLNIPLPSVLNPSLDSRIPQIAIFDLLQNKFLENSSTFQKIWLLPRYLIIHFKRFSIESFGLEKNPTIISFPIKNLDLLPYLHPDNLHANPNTKYDLIANIAHKGDTKSGVFTIQMYHSGRNEWYEIENLKVEQILPQALLLTTSYIQLYKQSDLH
ncbi:ubiquitin carboxyl-terminal hydrolase family protein [Cryptosporidium serpentis]